MAHPAAEQIKEQETMIGMKQILRKYECNISFSILSTRGRQSEKVLQYIIRKGGYNSYQDAIEVAKVSSGLTINAHPIFELYCIIEFGVAVSHVFLPKPNC